MNNIWTTYLFPFLTIAGLLFLYFTIKNYLPSYFNEKGKNLATKEDISQITTLVESVKYNFIKETENLKANLSLLSNIQVGLIAEERNALINFNEKYSLWQNALTDIGLGDTDDYNDNELDNYKRKINELYTDLLTSETRLHLFIEDKELIELAHNLKLETLNRLAEFPGRCILELKISNFEIAQLKSLGQSLEINTKHKELLNKRTQSYRTFSQDMIANLPTIVELHKEFQAKCREHLYKLLDGQ
jgi:hypothetical protein